MKKSIVLSAVIAVFVLTAASAFAQAQNSADLSQYTEVRYSTGSNGELIITNIHVPQKKNISIEKVWDDDDNRDNYRPSSVCIELLANNVVVDNHTVTGSGNTWSYTFEDKVVYNQGSLIEYSVNENGTACSALPTPSDQNTCLLAGGAWNGSACSMSGGSVSPAPDPNPDTSD